jgi:hypothetical protein
MKANSLSGFQDNAFQLKGEDIVFQCDLVWPSKEAKTMHSISMELEPLKG